MSKRTPLEEGKEHKRQKVLEENTAVGPLGPYSIALGHMGSLTNLTHLTGQLVPNESPKVEEAENSSLQSQRAATHTEMKEEPDSPSKFGRWTPNLEDSEEVLNKEAFLNHIVLEVLFIQPDLRIDSAKSWEKVPILRKFSSDFLVEYYKKFGRHIFSILDVEFLIRKAKGLEINVMLEVIVKYLVTLTTSGIVTEDDKAILFDRFHSILVDKHPALYDLRSSLLDYIDGLYDRHEILALRILEALIDICSMNSHSSFGTLYKALQQLPTLCSTFYPQLGSKKNIVCTIIRSYFNKYLEGKISDTIISEFVKLWTLIAQAEYQYKFASEFVNHNFIRDTVQEIGSYLIKFLCKGEKIDKQLEIATLKCLSAIAQLSPSELEEVARPFITEHLTQKNPTSLSCAALKVYNQVMLAHDQTFIQKLLPMLVEWIPSSSHCLSKAIIQTYTNILEHRHDIVLKHPNMISNLITATTTNCPRQLASSCCIIQFYAKFPQQFVKAQDPSNIRAVWNLLLRSALVAGKITIGSTKAQEHYNNKLHILATAIRNWILSASPLGITDLVDQCCTVLTTRMPFAWEQTSLKHKCLISLIQNEDRLGKIKYLSVTNDMKRIKDVISKLRLLYVRFIAELLPTLFASYPDLFGVHEFYPRLWQATSSFIKSNPDDDSFIYLMTLTVNTVKHLQVVPPSFLEIIEEAKDSAKQLIEKKKLREPQTNFLMELFGWSNS